MRWRACIILLLVLGAVLRSADCNQCLTMLEEVNPKRVIHIDGQTWNIQFEVSPRRTTQRLATKVMKIFLTEVLGYSGVNIVVKEDSFDATVVFGRLSETVTYNGNKIIPSTMVNMETWIPPHLDTMPLLSKYDVRECGSIAPPGHFGWFIPERLSNVDDSWTTFTKQEAAARFDVDEANLAKVMNATINPQTKMFYCEATYCNQGMYIPDQCQSYRHKSQPCALLLSGYPEDTDFIKEQIEQLKLYVKVAWVGDNLKPLIKSLTKEYLQNSLNASSAPAKSLVVLHWTPSSVIPNQREFSVVQFPRCRTRGAEPGCIYESNRLVKLVWGGLEAAAKFAYEAINRAKFTAEMYEDMLSRYNRSPKKTAEDESTEDEIACDWIKSNLNYTLSTWMPDNSDKNKLLVGGIFPMSGTSYTAKSLVIAARMAKEAINDNNTVLRDYNLELLAHDGQCKSDMVMKSFIDYIVHNYYEKLVGILGPACSETVEPLVGVSKHYKTVIISYSAEGSSFNDRSKYPYFFRTIGENKQYKHVYLQLLQKFGWRRVASLTEDGQKYTEYISYMQDMLRDNGIQFVANLKFPREREADVMTRYLEDLKQKRARIIIADVNDVVARQVMCEAYKLDMTAEQGYVWFLPLWLLPRWYDTDLYNLRGEKVPCTTAEMMKAVNGYLGLSHAYFAPDDDIMQEGITVRQWRDRYESSCKLRNETPSNYAGYAYDAMWTYAYAMDRLIKENQSYVYELHSDHTVNRFTDIIAETDFYGVSGKIRFVGGPSRFSTITIVQYIDNATRVIGNFYPNVSDIKRDVVGGRLDLNVSALTWLSKEIPNDGSEPPPKCILGGVARLLDVSCEAAIVIVNIVGCAILGSFLLITFFFIKRKYDEKVREQEKIIQTYKLDVHSDTASLNKWEIQRQRVFINRKIGEGAFGTVYGGEAFFPEKGWLAVAVKTLKVGSSIEEKSDFLGEFETMKKFEHKNIIKLLAVCTKGEPVLVVMEFMLYGDLKTYLLGRRHLVNDQTYEDSDEISNKKLTAMALDVARALSYLAQSKFVHRDVASRNCLINAQKVVKLGDFGMARPMFENDYYKFNKKGMLPVRWMAPESLGLGIFTPASDVWSFGVLLYEIVTFGSFPFQGMSNNQVLAHVKVGNALDIPKGVNFKLESLMRCCWNVDHSKRPTAPEIVNIIAENPRMLSPCLDVPIASIHLDKSEPIDIHDIQLPENLRKFSLSLSWPPPQGFPPLPPLSVTPQPSLVTDVPLMQLEPHTDETAMDQLDSVATGDQECSRPLLTMPKYTDSTQNHTNNNKDGPRYVNFQPSLSKFPTTFNEDEDSMQLEEKTSTCSKVPREMDGMSFL